MDGVRAKLHFPQPKEATIGVFNTRVNEKDYGERERERFVWLCCYVPIDRTLQSTDSPTDKTMPAKANRAICQPVRETRPKTRLPISFFLRFFSSFFLFLFFFFPLLLICCNDINIIYNRAKTSSSAAFGKSNNGWV